MDSGRPATDEYAPNYERYVSLVGSENILTILAQQITEAAKAAEAFSAGRETYRYGEGKWSVRELFGHLIDAERVFGYRLFCISRGEKRSLPGFDENEYVSAGGACDRPLRSLVEEFALLRRANVQMMRGFTSEQWSQSGVANDVPVTSRAIAYILAGHLMHHLEVLQTRYASAS